MPNDVERNFWANYKRDESSETAWSMSAYCLAICCMLYTASLTLMSGLMGEAHRAKNSVDRLFMSAELMSKYKYRCETPTIIWVVAFLHASDLV